MRRSPSLASLRQFLGVARTTNISEAARLAHVSQPALSRTIRLLEEDLGVRLFDRTSRNVTLTSAGDLLLPTVERLIADFDHAFVTLSKDLEGTRGRVVIGALPSFAATLLPPLIQSFSAAYPAVEISIRDELAGQLYRQLRDGQIDLVFATAPEQDGFVFRSLLSDPCVLVVQAGSPLDCPTPAEWSVVANHPFLGMAANSSVRQLTDLALVRAHVSVKPLYEVSQLVTMGGLIAAGLGVTVLPQSTLAMLGSQGVASRTLCPPVVERVIGLACRSDRSLSPAAAAFRRHGLATWDTDAR
jgi:LysR family carnitine catabolism transcriptional activator